MLDLCRHWTKFHDGTSDKDGEILALRGEVMVVNKVVINTAVVALVGLACSRKPEDGRVMGRRLKVAVCLIDSSEDEAELTSGILWLHRAVDGESAAHDEEHISLMVVKELTGREYRDFWPKQNVCRQRQRQNAYNLLQMLQKHMYSSQDYETVPVPVSLHS